ncbi:MAG: DNA repair and recombination protein RadB [Candidatus Pacearchaeota archaeon]|jgi:DNA repair protein RadB
MSSNKISAGSYDLNTWLYGGYEKDIITTVYGPAGSGKTNFCMIAAVSQAKKEKKVIFIDTEGGFSVDRFKQICQDKKDSDYEQLIKNILIMKPTTFSDQKKIFESLYREINNDSNIGLIVIDSMTMLYRIEIGDANEEKNDFKIKIINKELAKQLSILSSIARNKNIPILVTNQIYYSFVHNNSDSPKEKEAKMVGGDLLRYWSKCLIELELSNSKRTAILRKHRSLPEKTLSFIISNEGIKKKGWI